VRPTTTVFAFVLLVGGCSPPPADLAAEAEALRAAAAAYHEAAAAKDANRVVGFYDADALMIPPNADTVDGLDAVRRYRFGFIETPGVELDFEIVRAEVSSQGDMGWTFSLGRITINQPDGTTGLDIVRDFHTWRKQPDGSWLVVVDMWNSGMPADD